MKKLHEFYTAGTGTALLVGNPAASAINAPKGKKYDAWKDAYGNAVVDRDIGASVGLIAGAGVGAGAGALVGRSNLGKRIAARGAAGGDIAERLAKFKIAKKAATPAGALVGGLAGLGLGGFAGLAHGHYGKRAQEIRNRHLSANLKPALRELAARSEQITEFAMVRDASGRYVEVEEDGGMGVGGAIKAGAGAAALGGAGYGAYRADKAIMGKFAPKVVSGNTAGFGNMAGNSAEKLAAFKSAKANFSGMGAMDQRKAVYGAAGKAFKGGLLSKLAGAAKFLR